MGLCVGAGAGALAAVASGCAATEGPSVVARDEGGREVARATLGPSRRFALAYRHSYYREPAREWFVAGHDSFRLHSIASPSEAVLDYYALEGRKRRGRGGWLSLEPRRPPRYRELALIATAEGRRTLTVGERELPLFGPGEARHLTVSVER